MDSFYSLQGYLYLSHRYPNGVAWCGVVVGGLLLLLWARRGRPREYAAPLGVILLGGSLLCLPAWRELDGWFTDVDIALLSCFARDAAVAVRPEGGVLPSQDAQGTQDVGVVADVIARVDCPEGVSGQPAPQDRPPARDGTAGRAR